MKKLLLMATVLFATSCATVTKTAHRLTQSHDSAYSVKKDTSTAIVIDSVTHAMDKSIVVVQDHIVNDFSIPGSVTTANLKLTGDFIKYQKVVANNGSDSLELSYDTKDSTVYAKYIQQPKTGRQVIDRTTTSHLNTSLDTKVNKTATTSGTTDNKTKVKDKTNLDNTTKVVKSSIFSSPFFIIGIVLLLVGIVFVGLFKLKIL